MTIQINDDNDNDELINKFQDIKDGFENFRIWNEDFSVKDWKITLSQEVVKRKKRQYRIANWVWTLLFIPLALILYKIQIPILLHDFLLYFFWGWFVGDLHRIIREW